MLLDFRSARKDKQYHPGSTAVLENTESISPLRTQYAHMTVAIRIEREGQEVTYHISAPLKFLGPLRIDPSQSVNALAQSSPEPPDLTSPPSPTVILSLSQPAQVPPSAPSASIHITLHPLPATYTHLSHHSLPPFLCTIDSGDLHTHMPLHPFFPTPAAAAVVTTTQHNSSSSSSSVNSAPSPPLPFRSVPEKEMHSTLALWKGRQAGRSKCLGRIRLLESRSCSSSESWDGRARWSGCGKGVWSCDRP